MKSIQWHDAFVMASPLDDISYIRHTLQYVWWKCQHAWYVSNCNSVFARLRWSLVQQLQSVLEFCCSFDFWLEAL